MCTLRLPPRIVEYLDKLRRTCLWRKQTKDGVKCSSLAAWDLVCQPKDKGGLGVLNLKLQNQGLLLKHLHKFYNKCDVPWVDLIWSAYYTDGVPHAMEVCASFWWKDVMQLADIYRGITMVQANIGDTILFWKDMWQHQILSESHPRAFSFAVDEDMSVKTLLSVGSLSEVFNIPLSAQAECEVEGLQALTASVNLQDETPDEWKCVWGHQFTAAKYYTFCFRDDQADVAFAWIWKTCCNMKWKVFAWLLLVDRLNTRNMLRRRHFVVTDNDYKCVLCAARPEETLTHLFFSCPFTAECWSTLGIAWPNLDERFSLLHEGKRAWGRPMFMEVFVVAAWGIWKERNNKCFRRIPQSVSSWKARFKEDFHLLTHRASSKLIPFVNSLVGSL